MKSNLTAAGILSAGVAAFTKDDVIFALSLLIVIINLIIEYLRSKRNNDDDDKP